MTRLAAHQLSAGYDDRAVIHDVELSWSGGQCVALAGPNGSGKSTLLKSLASLIPPVSGHVELDGVRLGGLAPRGRARRIAYMPPDGSAVWPLIARRAVALGRAPHLKPLRDLSAADQEAIDSALERAGVLDLAERRIDTLSSGERARVMLARVLATGADVLLLDEPTAALDPRHQLAVMETLHAEAARGALVIMAAHALDLVARYCGEVVLMNDGRVDTQGDPADILNETNLTRVFGAAPRGGVQATRWEISG